MGNRDIRRHQKKKPKKEEGKATALRPVVTNPPVKVVPKGKTNKEPKE